jgi:hypothetical protein
MGPVGRGWLWLGIRWRRVGAAGGTNVSWTRSAFQPTILVDFFAIQVGIERGASAGLPITSHHLGCEDPAHLAPGRTKGQVFMSQIHPSAFIEQLIIRLGLGRRPPRDHHAVHVNSRFLSDVELSFFHALRQAAGTWAAICPKVALKDLLIATEPDTGDRIDQRCVDFVLFDPETMRPLLAIDLETRPSRDTLVDDLLTDAGLPYQRVPLQRSYPVRELAAGLRQATAIDETSGWGAPGANGRTPGTPAAAVPSCPLCGRLMALRTVAGPGPYEGKQFWACADYPQCRGVREYRPAK